MRKIVAIGGGEIGRQGYQIETLKIDEEIIKLSGKKTPLVLFIPTASKDSEMYVTVFKEHFGGRLKCQTDVLYLNGNSKITEITNKILSADIIYVGGGNTLRMMTLWRKLGVDKVLKRAWEKGIVLSGLSAGGICWFDFGHSDSRKFTSKKVSWDFIKVKGLGFYPFVFCPHYHFEKREKDFETMIKRDRVIGLAFDNKTALEIVDDRFRILKSNPSAKAYKIFYENEEVQLKELTNQDFQPLTSLM
jgi:dipeptidase E